jgi:hypothetical protein
VAPIDPDRITTVINQFSHALAKRLPDPNPGATVGPSTADLRGDLLARWKWLDLPAGRPHLRRHLHAQRPVPGATPSPDQSDFLHAVIEAVEEAAEEMGSAHNRIGPGAGRWMCRDPPALVDRRVGLFLAAGR